MAEDKTKAGAEAPAIIEELTVKLAVQAAENEALKAELEDAAKVVADLKEQLADKAAGGLTVKVGKEKYEVVGGGYHKGKAYTKEDIAADAKIAGELIAKKSQLLILKKG
jgi:hypothetical protein